MCGDNATQHQRRQERLRETHELTFKSEDSLDNDRLRADIENIFIQYMSINIRELATTLLWLCRCLESSFSSFEAQLING